MRIPIIRVLVRPDLCNVSFRSPMRRCGNITIMPTIREVEESISTEAEIPAPPRQETKNEYRETSTGRAETTHATFAGYSLGTADNTGFSRWTTVIDVVSEIHEMQLLL
ncbi:hypothetical protein B7494_g3118 [Chlorociboria aeruginascens]|nr:hypothetical protein B7494_g3118 [Chlorociboria aeruginascens]